MTINYAKSLGRDRDGAALQQFPAPFTANARYTTTNAVASSVISLNPNTTEIEITPIGGLGAVIKWIPLTDLTQASVIASGVAANYDHVIPANWQRSFVVPRETQGLGTAGMQVGSTFGLYQRVAIINVGTTASSVLVTEF